MSESVVQSLRHLPYRLEVVDRDDLFLCRSECVFIGAAGFEERSVAVFRHLQPGTTLFGCALIFRYRNSEPYDNERAADMRHSLETMCLEDPQIVEVDADEPTASVHRIFNAIKRARDEMGISSAIIDVSGMTQMFGISTIHGCRENGIAEAIFYSEADEYFPLENEVDALVTEVEESGTYDYWELLQSEGLRSVHIHPEFAGSLRVGHPVALTVFAGYEPSRVRGLLDEYSPACVIALYGVPPKATLEWRNRLSRRLTEPILERWPSAGQDVSTFWPDEVYERLSSLYEGMGDHYDFAIALQCSKLQMIATYWFWRDHPEIQLVFTCPIAFNRDRYSRGIGRQILMSRSAVVQIATAQSGIS